MADDKKSGGGVFWHNNPLWGFMAALFTTLILADAMFLYFSFDWAGFDYIYVWWLRLKPFLAFVSLIAIREISRSPGATYGGVALGALLSLLYWYSLRFCGSGWQCY
jgi:hypothetical protein